MVFPLQEIHPRCTIVIIDDSTKNFSALDRASVLPEFIGDWDALPNPLTGASNIVVFINIFRQNTFQMIGTQYKKVVKALFPDRTNPAFGKGIGIGCIIG